MKTELAAVFVLGFAVFGVSFMLGGSTIAFLSDNESIGGANDSINITAADCFGKYCFEKDVFHGKIKDVSPRKFHVRTKLIGNFEVSIDVLERPPDSRQRSLQHYRQELAFNNEKFKLEIKGVPGSITSLKQDCDYRGEEDCRVVFNRSDIIDLAGGPGNHTFILHGELMNGVDYKANDSLVLYNDSTRPSDNTNRERGYSSTNSNDFVSNSSPAISHFMAEQIKGYSINISFVSNESLSVIRTKINNGNNSTILNESEFSNKTRNDSITYFAEQDVWSNGTFRVLLMNASDHAGNNGADGLNTSIEINGTSNKTNTSQSVDNTSIPGNSTQQLNNTTTTKNQTDRNNSNTSANISIDYSVSSTELVETDKLNVSASVENTGNGSGNISLELRVDGRVVNKTEVGVRNDSTKDVGFKIGMTSGTHQIRINQLNPVNVTVKKKLTAGVSVPSTQVGGGLVNASINTTKEPDKAKFVVLSDSATQIYTETITKELDDGYTQVTWNSSGVPNGSYELRTNIEKGTQSSSANATVSVKQSP